MNRLKGLWKNPWTYLVLIIVIVPITPPVIGYLGLLYLSILLSRKPFSAAIPEQSKTINLITQVATVLQWILTLIFVCIFLALIIDRGFRWFFLGY